LSPQNFHQYILLTWTHPSVLYKFYHRTLLNAAVLGFRVQLVARSGAKLSYFSFPLSSTPARWMSWRSIGPLLYLLSLSEVVLTQKM